MDVARPLHEALALLDLDPDGRGSLATVAPACRATAAALLELVLQQRIAVNGAIAVLSLDPTLDDTLDETLGEIASTRPLPTVEWLKRLALCVAHHRPRGRKALDDRGELMDTLRAALFDGREASPRLAMALALVSIFRMESALFGHEHPRARARAREILSQPGLLDPGQTAALGSVAVAVQMVVWS